MNTTTPPEITRENNHGTESCVKKHPAFGMVSLSRRSGGRSRLFGSELDSGQVIALQIRQAQEIWSLSEKRYYAERRPVIEVEMTAAQFAELITTMNIGDGVPCTIRSREGKQVPDFVDNETLRDKILDDLKQDTKEVNDLLSKLESELQAALASSGMSKAKQGALLSTMAKVRQQVTSNMPFVLDQYVEGVEKVTASAKAEVEAMVMHTVTQLGLKSLRDIQTTGVLEDA